MTTTKDEYLSALVDDELGEFERRRLLDEVTSDPATAERWGRYHLIGEALRGGLPARTDPDFVARVQASLVDLEPLHVEPGSRVTASPGRLAAAATARPLLGMALAASVAAVTVLGVQALLGDRDGSPTQLVESTDSVLRAGPESGDAAIAKVEAVVPPSRPWSAEPDDVVRLNSYLVTHSEHSAVPGMLPQVRVVGYTSEQE